MPRRRPTPPILPYASARTPRHPWRSRRPPRIPRYLPTLLLLIVFIIAAGLFALARWLWSLL